MNKQEKPEHIRISHCENDYVHFHVSKSKDTVAIKKKQTKTG